MADSKDTVELQITDGEKLRTIIVRPLWVADVVHPVLKGDKVVFCIPFNVPHTRLSLVLVENVERREGWDG